jgi:hypothetical protein
LSLVLSSSRHTLLNFLSEVSRHFLASNRQRRVVSSTPFDNLSAGRHNSPILSALRVSSFSPSTSALQARSLRIQPTFLQNNWLSRSYTTFLLLTSLRRFERASQGGSYHNRSCKLRNYTTSLLMTTHEDLISSRTSNTTAQKQHPTHSSNNTGHSLARSLVSRLASPCRDSSCAKEFQR